jgi:hypothetical protein
MVGSAREGTDNNGYALEISVMDASTGSSVKALMTVYYGNDVAAKLETDENGLARAELPAGNYTYSVEARGYQPVKGRFFIVDSAVALTISMEPVPNNAEKGVLQAHLIDAAKGGPVLGVMTIYHSNGRYEAFKSNERGLVKAELLMGEYTYSVESRGYEPVKGRFVLNGTVLEIRVPMKPMIDEEPEPFGVIHGMVVGPEKKPMAGVVVQIMGAPIRVPMDPSVMNSDGTMPPDNTGNAFIERVQTDREGNFKVRVPFGGYQLIVELEGFNPYFNSIEVSKENSEVRVHIMLEKMNEERPPFPDMARAVVDLSYADMDSDGNPEKAHLVIDLDGDRIPELEFSMVDRNSDGNPEEFDLHSSLPLMMRERIMGLLMIFMEDPSVFPFPEGPGLPDDGDKNNDGAWEGEIGDIDWEDLIERLAGGDEEEGTGPTSEAEEDLDDDSEGNSDPVVDREGANDNDPSYLLAGGALVALFLLILTIFAFGVLMRTKRD